MPKIAVVGSKGGVGKTTLAVNLMGGLTQYGSVVLLDSDPQQSALQWSVIRNQDDGPEVVDASQTLRTKVREWEAERNHVIIDCPPTVNAPQTLEALQVADIAIVPVQPSPLDLWAMVHIVETIEVAMESNQRLHALMVINQLESRTLLSRFAHLAVRELQLAVASTVIRRRAIYRTSMLEGRTVYQMGKRGVPAAKEITQLIDEVIQR